MSNIRMALQFTSLSAHPTCINNFNLDEKNKYFQWFKKPSQYHRWIIINSFLHCWSFKIVFTSANIPINAVWRNCSLKATLKYRFEDKKISVITSMITMVDRYSIILDWISTIGSYLSKKLFPTKKI